MDNSTTKDAFELTLRYHDGLSSDGQPTSLFLEAFHHICCMPAYERSSPEELRLRDYRDDPVLSTLHSGLLLATVEGAVLPRAPSVPIARTYTRYGAEIILFEAGREEPRKFAIHKSLITHRSEFVRLALQHDWKEAKERKISMPDEDPKIFEIYQIFLYDHDIYNSDVTSGRDQYQILVKAYLLGEKLVDIGFRNAIVDAIIIRLRNSSSFDPRLSNLVYENTPDNSPLRRLWRDIYVWAGSARWFDEKELEEPINGDFMRDVNEGQFHVRRKTGPPLAPFLDDTNGWATYHVQAVQTSDEKKLLTPKNWKIKPW